MLTYSHHHDDFAPDRLPTIDDGRPQRRRRPVRRQGRDFDRQGRPIAVASSSAAARGGSHRRRGPPRVAAAAVVVVVVVRRCRKYSDFVIVVALALIRNTTARH